MELRIEGAAELMAKLKRLGKGKAAEQAVHKGMLQGAKTVQGSAKLLCPVDSGRLRDSIEIEDVSQDTVAVGTNVEYAVYVEYGTGQLGDPTVPHTTKEYWRYQDEDGNWHTTHGQPPRPYLTPALSMSQTDVKRKVIAQLQKAIKET